MKTTTIALSFALVLTSVQAADAVDANGQYRIEGVGKFTAVKPNLWVFQYKKDR